MATRNIHIAFKKNHLGQARCTACFTSRRKFPPKIPSCVIPPSGQSRSFSVIRSSRARILLSPLLDRDLYAGACPSVDPIELSSGPLPIIFFPATEQDEPLDPSIAKSFRLFRAQFLPARLTLTPAFGELSMGELILSLAIL